jgi:hypothetical protein
LFSSLFTAKFIPKGRFYGGWIDVVFTPLVVGFLLLVFRFLQGQCLALGCHFITTPVIRSCLSFILCDFFES